MSRWEKALTKFRQLYFNWIGVVEEQKYLGRLAICLPKWSPGMQKQRTQGEAEPN